MKVYNPDDYEDLVPNPILNTFFDNDLAFRFELLIDDIASFLADERRGYPQVQRACLADLERSIKDLRRMISKATIKNPQVKYPNEEE